MKVIFLDIDGVLVTKKGMEQSMAQGLSMVHEIFDPEAVANLNHVIEHTQAKVVVSSTWRLLWNFPDLLAHMARNGIQTECIIDITPNFDKKRPSGIWTSVERGHEIQAWLDTHPDLKVSSFVIIDDDADMAHLLHRLIATEFETGLTKTCAIETIKLFDKP